ncbi:MAG TPA: hypothetical protein VFW06_02340 [Acidimicrobiia bacterium]|nr:hypothetical protein [Acidimicrobiia bacterium]
MAKSSWFRRALGAGVLAGAAYAVWRAIESNRADGDAEWEPQPFPFPPQPRAAPRRAGPVTAPVSARVEPSVGAADTTLAPEPVAAPESDVAPAPEPGAWIDAVDGACPVAHPVKVARGSKVFHVPGGQMYERTTAERCYRDAAAAEADGLRQSKR